MNIKTKFTVGDLIFDTQKSEPIWIVCEKVRIYVTSLGTQIDYDGKLQSSTTKYGGLVTVPADTAVTFEEWKRVKADKHNAAIVALLKMSDPSKEKAKDG